MWLRRNKKSHHEYNMRREKLSDFLPSLQHMLRDIWRKNIKKRSTKRHEMEWRQKHDLSYFFRLSAQNVMWSNDGWHRRRRQEWKRGNFDFISLPMSTTFTLFCFVAVFSLFLFLFLPFQFHRVYHLGDCCEFFLVCRLPLKLRRPSVFYLCVDLRHLINEI